MATIAFRENILHPEGSFEARITAIEEEEMQYGPTLKIHLTTEEGVLEGLCSLSYSPKSKLTSLVRAIWGQIPENLDTDDLLSKKVGVVVETVDKEGVAYSKVASFYRIKSADKGSAVKRMEDPFVR